MAPLVPAAPLITLLDGTSSDASSVTVASTAATASPVLASGDDPELDVTEPASWLDWFLGIPLKVILIVVIGSIALIVVRHMIKSVTDRIARDKPVTESGRALGGYSTVLQKANPLARARRAQRAKTIGSVLRSSANILFGSIILLLVLDTLGVNIAPFIASAGIAGVALGFGAQALVKDFLSGTFMLLEDQYGVGDTVDLGDVVGTVEEVALRVTKVRDLEGTLWFIRNGEILRTGNMSQEWSSTLVEFPVPLSADIGAVREILEAAATRTCADPRVAESVLDAPEVTGVESIKHGRLTFRVRIRTKPGMQWAVARELRIAVRDDLAAAGISLAIW
ncbi:mechanosensitive ion channel protein MscS [Paraoerskovia sediminicola]|uniref:Mechanosensitive ion channel protein MscS n=1 Tax=Paraoerskovia sediminicola TaxID=1138587 RepID=A0ABM8FYA9_9CELL|nr:mechanosensitive ion channel family protein [Paraoerskovia sediminicola]BDZ40744.1 mechanosensitive ion channel protein MscS [Paraoerskovia sediminicola]